MSKLIDVKHPFEIKKIKDINEYLFILKNILRIAAQKKILVKPKGFSLPVRWSKNLNKVVVDFGSNKQRDTSGIHLDNLSFYYDESSDVFNSIKHVLTHIENCSNSDMLFEKYKLKKNENRFFELFVSNMDCVITGLYMRCQNSQRDGIYSRKGKKSILLNNSEDFLLDVKKSIEFFKIPEIVKIKSDHKKLYLDFLNKVENEFVCIVNKNDINQELYLNNYIHNTTEKNKLKITDYLKIINKEISFDENTMFWFLIYHLTLMFNNILLENLNVKNIDNIIVYDNISEEIIKIVKEFKINNILKEIKLYSPIMPVSF